MRVAIEAASLGLSSGGLARYTSELSLALARRFPDDEFFLVSDQPFRMPADGQWHFVAVTVSSGASGVGEFYVDGHPPVSFTPTAVTLATTAPFLVGESVFDNQIGRAWCR